MSDGKLRNVLKLIIYNLKAFFQSGNYVINTSEIAKDIKEILIQSELRTVRNEERYKDSRSLILGGYKMYSQNDEDGIIKEIFKRIGTTNKIFVEFGVGDGLENNTLALLYEDWKGLWIDASETAVNMIKDNLENTIKSGSLKVIHSLVTRDNINKLIEDNINFEEIDLISIDIDGNDFQVFSSIKCVNPRVIVIEYNSKFPPHVSYCMAYDESHVYSQDDCFGASLKFLVENIQGYSLVGCNITGVNAFFVRKDLINDQFLEPFTAENHYEPGRMFLTPLPASHPAAYKTLEKLTPSLKE